MSYPPSREPKRNPSGQEPGLGGNTRPQLTGLEPMLGGARRAAVDTAHIQALLDGVPAEQQHQILDNVRRFGQADLYARELALAIPAHARQKVGSWRGTFTPGQRIRAIRALALIGSYESIPPLLDVLADQTYRQVASEAGKALTAICARLDPAAPRTRQVFRDMTGMLRTLPVIGRKVVARILAAAPPDLVLGPLLKDALTAGEWWARREAAWVLGTLGDRRATRRLIDALGDESSTVRASAAWALGRLDAPVAVSPLAAAAEDADEVVRAAAVEALGAQTANLSALDGRFRQAIDLLIASLSDDDLSVRHAALEALNAVNAPEARMALEMFVTRRTLSR